MEEQEKTLEPSPEGAFVWEEDAPILPDATPEAEDSNSGTEAESETPEAPSDSEPETPVTEPEPDYKALYEGEKERQNAEKYRAVYNEQMGMTGNEAIARMIARSECGGKDYPLEDAPAPETPSTDFRAALTELQSLYPDATEMPENVMREFMSGKSLKDAYAAHRAVSDKQTIEQLWAEVAALKKGASNRAAAPVKGSNGSAPEKTDPFSAGFDAEW